MGLRNVAAPEVSGQAQQWPGPAVACVHVGLPPRLYSSAATNPTACYYLQDSKYDHTARAISVTLLCDKEVTGIRDGASEGFAADLM